jgi:ABC-type ATPase with predicted acetyltransferase domain
MERYTDIPKKSNKKHADDVIAFLTEYKKVFKNVDTVRIFSKSKTAPLSICLYNKHEDIQAYALLMPLYE